MTSGYREICLKSLWPITAIFQRVQIPRTRGILTKYPRKMQEEIGLIFEALPSTKKAEDEEEDGDWRRDSLPVPSDEYYGGYARYESLGDQCSRCGCSLCHRPPDFSFRGGKLHWLISLAELKQSATTCSSCDMLWQAVLFAKPHSTVQVHSIELQYELISGQLFLRCFDEEGKRDDAGPYEFYRGIDDIDRKIHLFFHYRFNI
jgi:hypothetical protein